MRKWLCLIALAVAGSGCDDLFGTDEQTPRLILTASPRQTTTDGTHISLIDAEAVTPGTRPPGGSLCVHLTAHFGIFDASASGPTATRAAMPTDADAGVTCDEHCIYMRLPSGWLRRNFALYGVPSVAAQDVMLGELFQSDNDDAPCPPPPGSAPLATAFLTLQVPDSPLPMPDFSSAADLSAAISMDLSAAAPMDLTPPPDLTPPADLSPADGGTP